MDRSQLQNLRRKQIQRLAKLHGIAANKTTEKMIDELLLKLHPTSIPETYLDESRSTEILDSGPAASSATKASEPTVANRNDGGNVAGDDFVQKQKLRSHRRATQEEPNTGSMPQRSTAPAIATAAPDADLLSSSATQPLTMMSKLVAPARVTRQKATGKQKGKPIGDRRAPARSGEVDAHVVPNDVATKKTKQRPQRVLKKDRLPADLDSQQHPTRRAALGQTTLPEPPVSARNLRSRARIGHLLNREPSTGPPQPIHDRTNEQGPSPERILQVAPNTLESFTQLEDKQKILDDIQRLEQQNMQLPKEKGRETDSQDECRTAPVAGPANEHAESSAAGPQTVQVHTRLTTVPNPVPDRPSSIPSPSPVIPSIASHLIAPASSIPSPSPAIPSIASHLIAPASSLAAIPSAALTPVATPAIPIRSSAPSPRTIRKVRISESRSYRPESNSPAQSFVPTDIVSNPPVNKFQEPNMFAEGGIEADKVANSVYTGVNRRDLYGPQLDIATKLQNSSGKCEEALHSASLVQDVIRNQISRVKDGLDIVRTVREILEQKGEAIPAAQREQRFDEQTAEEHEYVWRRRSYQTATSPDDMDTSEYTGDEEDEASSLRSEAEEDECSERELSAPGMELDPRSGTSLMRLGKRGRDEEEDQDDIVPQKRRRMRA